MCIIVSLSFVEGPTCIGNYPLFAVALFLIEYSAEPCDTSICVQNERLGVIGISQHWSFTANFLKSLKRNFTSVIPINLLMFSFGILSSYKLVQWSCNFSIPLNKLLIVVSEPCKTTYLSYSHWSWPVLYCFDFLRVSRDTLL